MDTDEILKRLRSLEDNVGCEAADFIERLIFQVDTGTDLIELYQESTDRLETQAVNE